MDVCAVRQTPGQQELDLDPHAAGRPRSTRRGPGVLWFLPKNACGFCPCTFFAFLHYVHIAHIMAFERILVHSRLHLHFLHFARDCIWLHLHFCILRVLHLVAFAFFAFCACLHLVAFAFFAFCA